MSTHRLPHLHLVSAAWGFGPTAALTQVLDALSGSHWQVSVDVPDQARALVLNSHPEEHAAQTRPSLPIRFTSTDEVELRDSLVVNFGRVDLLHARPVGRRHMFVDCAPWLNSGLIDPDAPAHFEYLTEYFPPQSQVSAAGAARRVRPCVARHPRRARRTAGNNVLISTGGAIVPGRYSENPLSPMLARLGEELSHLSFLTAKPTGGTSSGQLKTITHRENTSLIRAADIVITVPGLYTLFESLEAGCAPLLLPPTNYTQYIQFLWYRQAGLVAPPADWLEMGVIPSRAPPVASLADELAFTARLRAELGPARHPLIRERICRLLDNTAEFIASMESQREVVRCEFLEANLPSLPDIINAP